MKIAIIGKGHVGTALAKSLGRKHEIRFGHRDPNESVEAAIEWGEIVILAMPYEAAADVARAFGSAVNGKVVVDCTNPLNDQGELSIGFSTSAAEEIQKKMPQALVVKAFNTVSAKNQSTGKVGQEQITLFVASDFEEAREVAMQLGRDIGFDPIDAGPLKASRYLEPMAKLIIDLGFSFGSEVRIGYKLLKVHFTKESS